MPEYVERYLRVEFKLDAFITHRMPLEDINNAVDFMEKGESILSVVLY